MIQAQYEKSIRTGELQLDAWGKFSYFSLVGFLFLITLALLPVELFVNLPASARTPIWVPVIPGILGIFLYRLQKRRLKFDIVKTGLNGYEFFRLVQQLSKEIKWKPVFAEGEIFVAKTESGLFSVTRPKQITILLNKDVIMINSIFDPDSKGTVDIMGQNKKAIAVVISKIVAFEKNCSMSNRSSPL